jgi:predicted nucleotidyltransferase
MRVDFSILQDLCERYDVTGLRVYGSYAREEVRAEGDIDLLADLATPPSFMRIVRADREYAERRGRPVDSLTEASTSPYGRKRVLTESQVVYERAAWRRVVPRSQVRRDRSDLVVHRWG